MLLVVTSDTDKLVFALLVPAVLCGKANLGKYLDDDLPQ